MVVYGGHGTGKSTFALRCAYLKREDGKPFRILYIDNEMGSVDDYLHDLSADGIDTRNILLVYTTSLDETKEYINQAVAKTPFKDEEGNVVLDADGDTFVADMIVVDGMSVLYQSSIQAKREFSKQRATSRADKKEDISALERFVTIEGADIEIKDYSAIKYDGKSLVLDLTGCGLHYIITAREKEIFDKKIIKVNGVDKEVQIPTGRFEPEGFNDVVYNVKTVARLWRDEKDGMIKMKCSKDRTHTFDEGTEIEDPSSLEFQKMIDRNKESDRKFFAPKNTMKDDIAREMKKTEIEILGTTIEEADKTNGMTNVKKQVDGDSGEKLKTLSEEAKNIVNSLNPIQKEKLKTKLTEAGFKTFSRAAIKTVEQMQMYLDIAKSVSTEN